MENKIFLNKEYYLEFLIKMFKERFYHEDYCNLNLKKLNLLNSYLNLNNHISFDYTKKMFVFLPLKEINVSKLKHIKGFSKFDFNNVDVINNISKYIEMYFNILLLKYTNEDYKIVSGITYETNETNEFVKSLMNHFNKDSIIYSHMQQIKIQYKEALNILFDSLYGENIDKYINNENQFVNWNLFITDENHLEILNYSLNDLDYF